MAEEAGELCAAVIRADARAIRDAFADVVISVLAVPAHEGFDPDAAIAEAWTAVRARDYVKYPGHGRPQD